MEMTEYAPGTPSWVDLGVDDIDAAAAFYGELFGWDVPPGEEQYGHYRSAELRGRPVAGLGPKMNPGPPVWSTYVSTDDIDALSSAVTAAGGAVVVPAMAVLAQGSMAVFTDDTGTFISAWQPGDHRGAGLVNEPGALAWNELMTRHATEAKGFYGTVFGWTGQDHDMGPAGTYTEWHLDGRSIGGMMPMGDGFPAEVPNHWAVYFAVADADSSVAKVTELGGTVMMEPFDIQQGRVAVVADSQGAAFNVIALNDPPSS